MAKTPSKTSSASPIPRPPVVVVMGHIDHGKTTLLDYIRKANVVAKESGGITQHTSAYEFEHTDPSGKKRHVTFLDTPGHEAFGAMRARGAKVADVAILVVSAEDGVKPQTLDAYKAITSAGIPFVVACNKIDKPNANIEKTKATLAEASILVEGYGGDIPWNAISAKVGTGVSELIDTIFLLADLKGITGITSKPGEGVIVESHMDSKKGATATIIVTDGTFTQGAAVVAENTFAPLRIMENFLGRPVKEAGLSAPLRISGWSAVPAVGATVRMVATKRDAEHEAAHFAQKVAEKKPVAAAVSEDTAVVPLILKSDVMGTLEGIEHELRKIAVERVHMKIVAKGLGDISENDVKLLSGSDRPIVIGFKVGVDARAKELAERHQVSIKTFDIIYELTEWLKKSLSERKILREVEKVTGEIRVLRCFSQQKEKQVLGGRVQTGVLKIGDRVRITRRDTVVGEGKVMELQAQKIATKEVTEGNEFGAMIESKHLIAERDTLHAFTKVVE
jgi:translation initiation factor IF-2